MGVIKRGILGGFSGSVGNIVGSSWKGIDVMKTKPLSVANPRTAGQVAQRSKFGAVVALAQVLLSGIVKPLWDRFAQQMSGFNSFISGNIDAFDVDGLLTPADLQISRGSLKVPDVINILQDGATANMDVTWDTNVAGSNGAGTDEIYIVLQNSDSGEYSVSSAEYTRAQGAGVVSFSEAPAVGTTVYGWIAARRADGSLVSNTSFGFVVT